MNELERLQQLKIEIQRRLEKVDDRINRLWQVAIRETRVEERLRLEGEIKEAENYRKRFSQELDETEYKISALNRETDQRTQSREINYHALVVFGPTDEILAKQLAKQLDKNLLLSPTALFARQPIDFEVLDNQVCQCHMAIVILSESLLNQLEGQREKRELILTMLKARTGLVIALCRDNKALQQAQTWGLPFEDVSTWQAKDGVLPDNLVSIVVKRISDHCSQDDLATVGLPFIVIAMTRTEALNLSDSSNLSPETFQQFQALKTELGNYGIDPFGQRYSSLRDHWRPFGRDRITIREAIEKMINYINDKRRVSQRYEPQIKAQYYPFDPIVNKQGELRTVYYEIAESGCIVVLDKLSIYHSGLRSSFKSHRLYTSGQVALAAISPLGSDRLSPNYLLEEELKVQLWDAFQQYADDYSPNYEFDVGNERRLKRWLHTSLPRTLDTRLELRPDNNRQVQWADKVNATGKNTKKTGWFKSPRRAL